MLQDEPLFNQQIIKISPPRLKDGKNRIFHRSPRLRLDLDT